VGSAAFDVMLSVRGEWPALVWGNLSCGGSLTQKRREIPVNRKKEVNKSMAHASKSLAPGPDRAETAKDTHPASSRHARAPIQHAILNLSQVTRWNSSATAGRALRPSHGGTRYTLYEDARHKRRWTACSPTWNLTVVRAADADQRGCG
jgi:hypothetical protein